MDLIIEGYYYIIRGMLTSCVFVIAVIFFYRQVRLILFKLTTSATFYGLAFNTSFLPGNKYLNFAVSTALDLLALVVMLWAVSKFGNRKPLILAFFCCAAASSVCSCVTAIPDIASPAVKYLMTVMAIVGKTLAGCTLCVIFIFTSELYPTVVRNVSLGVNTFWSRIGGMAAPQIFFVGLYTSSFVPFAVLALLTLTSGFMTMLLPETHNKTLSDRLEQTGPVSRDCKDMLQDNGLAGEENVQLYETSI